MSDKEKKKFFVQNVFGKDCLLGFAKSPGYETYKTGWNSFVIQDKKRK